jgi:hypothetical protein
MEAEFQITLSSKFGGATYLLVSDVRMALLHGFSAEL